MKKLYILFLLFSIFFTGQAEHSFSQTAPTEEPENQSVETGRIVGYFTSWTAYARNGSLADLDPALLTHLNFAFANLQEDGTIAVGDTWADLEKSYPGTQSKGHLGQLKELKQKNPNLKILISVGGWTWSNHFSSVASTDQGRKRFAQSAANFLSQYQLDGLDIDWEFPVEGGNNIAHLPQDKENYTLLIKETRAALNQQGEKDGKSYLLTIAGGPNPSFVQNTDLAAMEPYLDFINIMAYDYHGSWENKTGHNAPLFAEDGFSVSDTVNAYLKSGIQPELLNLGLAFYGRGWSQVDSNNDGLKQSGIVPSGTGFGLGTWEAGVFDYWDLTQNYVNQNGYVRYYDKTACSPYLFNGSTFISYDDWESISQKLNFVQEKNLGGIMFWEFYGDKEKELQKKIAHFTGQSASVVPSSVLPSPSASPSPVVPSPVVPSPSSVSEWDSQQIYHAGDQVQYQNCQYEAKWWTQNEPPNSKEEWGPWKPILN